MDKRHGVASLKRYFVTSVQPGTATNPDGTLFHCESPYHWMSLPGPNGAHDGGFIIVMMDGMWDPDPTWVELPHLLDNAPAYFDGIQHKLGTASVTTNTATVTSAQLATPTTTVATPAVSATIPGQAAPPVSAPTVTNNTTQQPLAGVSVTDTTFRIAKKLAAINRHFHP